MSTTNNQQTAQQRFNTAYITSTEIMTLLDVSRVAVFRARKSGTLPDPVVISGSHLLMWERAAVTPHLKAWAQRLAHKRRERA